MTTLHDQITAETYLGDGLYCRFDGYQFILRAPRPEGDHYVVLEPTVVEAFDTHRKTVAKLIREFPLGPSALTNSATPAG